jgi:peptidoglycan/LPS O-acetylase OafA/YrhL
MPLAFVWQTQQVVPYIAYYYGPYVLLIAYVCALILASLLYFWLVERPLNRRGRMLFDRLAQIVYAYRSAQNSPNR